MMHLKNLKLPRFEFHYEPLQHKLYIVDLTQPPGQRIGNLVHDKVPNPDIAQLVVTAWCSGYLNKERERFDPKAKQHHRLVAEHGFIPILGGNIGGER